MQGSAFVLAHRVWSTMPTISLFCVQHGRTERKGRRLGTFFSDRIHVAHALRDHLDANESINAFIISLLDSYAACMSETGKIPEEVASIIRNVAGWADAFNSLLSTFLTYKWISIPSREKAIRCDGCFGAEADAFAL